MLSSSGWVKRGLVCFDYWRVLLNAGDSVLMSHLEFVGVNVHQLNKLLQIAQDDLNVFSLETEVQRSDKLAIETYSKVCNSCCVLQFALNTLRCIGVEFQLVDDLCTCHLRETEVNSVAAVASINPKNLMG